MGLTVLARSALSGHRIRMVKNKVSVFAALVLTLCSLARAADGTFEPNLNRGDLMLGAALSGSSLSFTHDSLGNGNSDTELDMSLAAQYFVADRFSVGGIFESTDNKFFTAGVLTSEDYFIDLGPQAT